MKSLSNKEMLESYIKVNSCPILVKGLDITSLQNAVELSSDCNISELRSNFVKGVQTAPKWLNDLNLNKDETCYLVITDIDKVKTKDQMRFGEILKYRKIGTHSLPKNCVVILTANKIEKKFISRDIFEFAAVIDLTK